MPNPFRILLIRTPVLVFACTFTALPSHGAGTAAKPVSYPNLGPLRDVGSFDVVADGNQIHVLAAGRESGNGAARIIYLRSSDGGSTWGRPAAVNTGTAGIAARHGNDVQLAVGGRHIVAAWQGKGELPGTGPLKLAHSADSGATWSEGRSPAPEDPTASQSEADVILDNRGRLHAVWLDDREENGNTQGLRYARSDDRGNTWTAKATLDPAVCTCCWTRIALLSDQTPTALYRDDTPHDMNLVRMNQPPGSWGPPSPVGRFDWHFEGCPHCGGGLAVARKPSGSTVLHAAVWTGKEGQAGLHYLRSYDQGRHWSTPLRLGGEHSRHGDLAARSADNAAVVLTENGADGSRIHWRQTLDGGQTWNDPEPLSPAGENADHPRIVATAGGFRVFWTERRADGSMLAMAAPAGTPTGPAPRKN